MNKHEAFKLVADELDLAQQGHRPMHSAHEGYAVLLEEVEELWVEIKDGEGTTHRGVSEAVQVAAMAIRYLIDLCDDAAAEDHSQKVETWVAQQSARPVGSSFGGYSG